MKEDSASLQKLIDEYLNGSLNAPESAELSRLLDGSRAARDQFRENVAFHDSLYEHFSDEPDILGFELPKADAREKRFPVAWIAAAAAIVIAAVSLWQVREDAPVASLIHASEPEWVTDSSDGFPAGWHELRSGLAVLQIGDGVRLAIEGPARFHLHDEMHMTVRHGRISAQVEESGHGFTIETPEGRIVDFGTRFGVHVSDTGETEAHVFEGAIDVENEGATRRLTGAEAVRLKGLAAIESDSLSFPMPGRDDIEFSHAGDFEPASQLVNGMPRSPEVWGGDHARIVELPGNRAALEFVAPHSQGENSKGHAASEVWQLLDLREFSDEVNQGAITAKLHSSFNKSNSIDSARFQIQITAFRGQLSQAKEYWDRKQEPTSERLTQTSASFLVDDDETSWEPLEVTLHVPAGSDFLLISLNALGSETHDYTGRFADDIAIHFASEPRASVPQAFWKGTAGNWNHSENWRDGRPDRARDRFIISGDGGAVITNGVQLKQELVISLHTNSHGRLRIARGGQLAQSGHSSLIVGYNRGAEAELIVEGSLETRGRVYIGRNNGRSLLDLKGGNWNAGGGLIRMSQYDTAEADTNSKLWVRQGGSLQAARLEMVNDNTELHLEDGVINLEKLQVGGSEGRALVRLSGGELKVEQIVFGDGSGTINFDSEDGLLLLSGSWTADQLLAIPGSNWQLNGAPASASHFNLSPHQGFTRVQLSKQTPAL
ncbi:MAG: FecR domain-containing protein [Verrucomicrobiota bacterium]